MLCLVPCSIRAIISDASKRAPLKEGNGRDRTQGQCKSGAEQNIHASKFKMSEVLPSPRVKDSAKVPLPKSQQNKDDARVPERNQVRAHSIQASTTLTRDRRRREMHRRGRQISKLNLMLLYKFLTLMMIC